MDDDFPGRFFIEGYPGNLGGAIGSHSSPIELRADFVDDGDWIGIGGVAGQWYDLHFIVYLPEEGLDPISGQYQWAVFDEDLNELDSGEQRFRVPFTAPNFDRARYVRFTADANTSIDPVTNETIVTPAHYRVGVGFGGDIAGATTDTAYPYITNRQGILASSIFDADDVDFFSVELEAGVNYEFVLYTQLVINRPLRSPVFEIYDENGFVKGSSVIADDQLRIQFEAPQDNTWYLKIATEGNDSFFSTAAYEIRSPQFDEDLLADSPITRGVVKPGETFTNSVDFPRDVDWARLEKRRFFNYQIKSPLSDEIRLVTSGGDDVRLGRGASPDDVLLYTPLETYVEFSGDSPGEFLFDAIDLEEDTDLANVEFGGEQFSAAIEHPGDVDLYDIGMIPFVNYSISVIESEQNVWSGDLVLEMLNNDGSVRKAFNVTSEQNTFEFNVEDGVPFDNALNGILIRRQLARVRTNNDTTTGYQIELTPTNEDSVPDTLSTSELLPLRGGIARESGVLEDRADFDVYRVDLKANRYYELDRATTSGFVNLYRATESGSEQVNGFFQNSKEYFFFDEPGTYYIAAGGADKTSRGSFAAFQFKFTEDGIPDPSTRNWYPNGFYERFTNLFGHRNLPTEVWSTVPFRASTGDDQALTNFAAGELHNLSAEQWNQIRVAEDVTAPGTIFYRNVFANGRPLPWEKYELINDAPIPELDPANLSLFDGVRRYWFPEELPFYLESDQRYNTSFEAVSDAQKSLVTTALNRWGSVGNQFSPGSSSSESDLQIFVADLGNDVDVLSFAPGIIGRTELVINSRSNLFNGDTFSDEAMFRLLQSIGTTMKLPLVDSVDRFVSVMGTESPEENTDVWPTWPMPADLRLSRTENYNTTGQTVFQFPETGGYAASVLSRPRQNTVVSAEGIALNASIDLRAGQSSSILNSDQLRTIHMAPGTHGYMAVGGSGNDGLRGNRRDNILEGNAGNDVLNGASGNDRLRGGPGNDYYIFEPASGLDFVDEQSGGGVDVLRIEGMYNYDSIEDYTFRKFGNDLLIRLELDGQRNNNGDQIRVSNMGNEDSRVEAMALLNTEGFVNRISLQSVWDQADEVRRRFRVVAGNDGLGSLVAPV
jgi:Ca2+-binding RTX toxin-like protein